MLQDFINNIWYHNNFLRYLLWPCSLLFRAGVFLRYCCYRLSVKKSTRFSVPVIVVGNITVGGTGKTPLVAFLANLLQEKGYRPGIVSRGYGGKGGSKSLLVSATSDPKLVGDEPILLAQKTNCPIVVNVNRVLAAKTLLQETACNIILSDDGLQHYSLARDIEIAVIDGQRRFGNGHLLPAGPLREPVSRLKRADFIICQGPKIATTSFAMELVPTAFISLVNPDIVITPKDFLKTNKSIQAVAGIANPERFFNSLQAQGFSLVKHVFSDHHPFQVTDFNWAKITDKIVMTEKDAIKCRAFADERFYYLAVELKVEKAFWQTLLKRIAVIGKNC